MAISKEKYRTTWLSSWFENSASHPTFSSRVNDGKEYRKKLYTYDEILEIIEKYGYPQDWNNNGKHGPERYIEAHFCPYQGS